jgi:hypothetical protein
MGCMLMSDDDEPGREDDDSEELAPPRTAALFPKLDTAALFPKLDTAALFPKLDTAALFPKLDTAALFPKLDTAALFPKLDRTLLEQLARRFQPRNLRGFPFDYVAAWTIMEEEGIPFVLVPDRETARLLVAAADAEQRRDVLRRRKDEVLASCESILALCVDDDIVTLGTSIRKALAALQDGHLEAAQALATNVLDRLVKNHPGGKNLVNRDAAALLLEQVPHRDVFFLTPIAGAHAKAWSSSPPVAGFSRHATAHQVGTMQYSEANCIHAVMLSTSLLGFWQDLW